MATTRILPLHAGKGRTVGKAIRSIIDYVKNSISTIAGLLGLAVLAAGESAGPALCNPGRGVRLNRK